MNPEKPLRLEWRSPRELAENPRNWRTHPESQVAALTDVISEVGWAGACLYNERTGRLIDGHARRAVAIDQGCESIPVLIGDWSEEDEAKILATLDPLAAMAGTHSEKLASLLEQVATDSDSLQSLLQDLSPPSLPSPGQGGDEFDPTPDTSVPTRTQTGEKWLLGGRHRLVVGDCTDAAVVASLFGDLKAEMVWTDPPYGVAIGDKNVLLNAIGRSNRIEKNLVNDTLDEDGLKEMLQGAFAIAAQQCEAGASWYVAAPAEPLHLVFAGAMRTLGVLRQMLLWVKNNATFSPLGVSYHWRHEPIFYGWLPNAAKRYHGGRTQDTVWEIDRPMASPGHPTMKPLLLVERAIENSSLPGQIVYDPFLGSGTTIIASHRTGRIGFGCEIDPTYADVILKRAEAEGLSCEKVEQWPAVGKPN